MVNKQDGTPFQKGMAFEKIGVGILKEEGFTDIEKLGTTFPVDFTALKEDIKYFIEVRGRSYDAKTQFFYFRPTKIEHMREANKIFPVYVLLINKWGHRLMPLEEMLSGKQQGIRIFKPKGKGNYVVYDFEKMKRIGNTTTEKNKKRIKCEDITDPRRLTQKNQPKIDAELRIHCPLCLRREFTTFVAKYDFPNQWGALLYLLKHTHEDVAHTGTRVVTVER
jgi:Holliday junction resolvase-like predicted endonuclease